MVFLKRRRVCRVKYFIGVFVWLVLVLSSCKNDEIDFATANKMLKFSRDTVFCDTVYNQVRSETYSVKVYNQENKDVKIPRIYLEGGENSQYRINVDGRSGYNFVDVPLRSKDSIFIFIEVAPNSSAKEAIAEDQIKFESTGFNQSIKLFSVIQDVEFFNGSGGNPYKISSNTVWNDAKAKIILGEVVLEDNQQLDILQGTKVYFHKNSSLTIGKNATLDVQGDLGKEVVFRGAKNSVRYDTIPKNWEGIALEQGATLNMNYVKMQGGTTAIYADGANVDLKNTMIYNFNDYGIYSIGSNIKAENMVMNSYGQSAIAMFKGGNCDLTHCTIANYWNFSYAPAYGIYAQNQYKDLFGAVNLTIKNSIVYNDSQTAVKFNPTQGQVFNYAIDHSLVKHDDAEAGFTWNGNPNVVSSIKNNDPLFVNYRNYKTNLRLLQNSPAIGIGSLIYASLVPLDIKKNSRTTAPNLGAYQ